MERNLDRRLETLTFVHDPALKNSVYDDVLGPLLIENSRALELLIDGSSRAVRVSSGNPIIDTQKELLAQHTSSD